MQGLVNLHNMQMLLCFVTSCKNHFPANPLASLQIAYLHENANLEEIVSIFLIIALYIS